MQRLPTWLSATQFAIHRVGGPRCGSRSISPYVDLGFTHLVFHAPGHDQDRFLAAFTEDVLPKLRDRFGPSDEA